MHTGSHNLRGRRRQVGGALVLLGSLCVASTTEAAGEILQSVAQILQAGAPIAVAGAQAKADVKIAEINSETQIALTQITADTQKYLADAAKDVALNQAYTAAKINEDNNNGVTERLAMQLAELRAARQDAYEAEREARRQQMIYDQQRIALAQKQAADNLLLAKMTLNAQLTQAGLSRGYSNSINSGDRLTVTRTGVASRAGASTVASAAGAGGGAPDPGAAGAAGGSGTAGSSTFPTGKGITTTPTSVASAAPLSPRATARGFTGSSVPNALAIASAQTSAPRNATSARLLSSVSRGVKGNIGFTASGDAVAVPSRAFAAAPRVAEGVGAPLHKLILSNKFSRGSTRTTRQRLELEARTSARGFESSDFSRFRAEGAAHRRPASLPDPGPQETAPAAEAPALPSLPVGTGSHAGE